EPAVIDHASVSFAHALPGLVEMDDIFPSRVVGRQVGAATKPLPAALGEETKVGVHRRYVRAARMQHQGNPGGGEVATLTGHVLPASQSFRGLGWWIERVWLASIVGPVGLGTHLPSAYNPGPDRPGRGGSLVAENPSDLVVETYKLTKIYQNRQIALNDVTLRIEPGCVLGLLGPNGAGKTTLLRLILGLHRPTAGWVKVFGQTMNPNAAALRCRIGYIPTNPQFPRGMTPITYLDYIARLFGLPAGVRKPRLA